MREFLKGICVFVILVGTIAAALAWIADRQIWGLRLALPTAVFAAVVIFLFIHFRRDEVPDYLHHFFGTFFDRDGFCFFLTANAENGICFFDLFFQNKYEQPCTGRVAVRPARNLLRRPDIETVTHEIDCEGGAYGVARMPMPVPPSLEGTSQKFEFGASVKFPHGKGRMLRFRDGIVIRTDSEFGDKFAATARVIGFFGGMLILSKPATMTIDLPMGVKNDIPDDVQATVTTLWKPGDSAFEELG